MTQTAHTPGPWDFFVGNANGKGLIRIETALENTVVGGGHHIASMQRGAVSEANAALIAASPTLYEYARKKANDGDAEAISMLDLLHIGK